MYFVEPVTGFMLIDTLIAGDKAAFVSALRHLILPAVTLGTIPLAVVARMTRSAMLEVLGEDYIRTARAKGLSPVRKVRSFRREYKSVAWLKATRHIGEGWLGESGAAWSDAGLVPASHPTDRSC